MQLPEFQSSLARLWPENTNHLVLFVEKLGKKTEDENMNASSELVCMEKARSKGNRQYLIIKPSVE